MSDKELLYIEDALNHLKHFIELCNYTSQNLSDQSLRTFVDAVKSEATSSQSELFGVLKRYGG